MSLGRAVLLAAVVALVVALAAVASPGAERAHRSPELPAAGNDRATPGPSAGSAKQAPPAARKASRKP